MPKQTDENTLDQEFVKKILHTDSDAAEAERKRLEYCRERPFMDLIMASCGVVIYGADGLTADACLETWADRWCKGGRATMDVEGWERAVMRLVDKKGGEYVFTEAYIPMAERCMPHWRELIQ